MNNLVKENEAKLFIIPQNPAPSGARVNFIKTSDNIRLRYALWRASGKNIKKKNKGTICLVHGRTEFIEKYFETINDFLQRGFAVATFDWRGQGGSERLINNKKLGYVDKFDDYIVDLQNFYSQILLPDCPPPYYLVGHSMGGLVALLAAEQDRLMFDRMFLSAPMLEVKGQPFSMDFMAKIANFTCYLGLGKLPAARNRDFSMSERKFAGNNLTSDFNRYMLSVKLFNSYPQLEILAPTFRWAAAAFDAMARAQSDDFPPKLNIPTLMLAAAKDKVVSSAAIEYLGLRLRIGRHAVIGAARHELFMENDDIRSQVFAAFDAFIGERTEYI